MLLVSRFSSINFDEDWKLPFQIQECYLQKFKPSDHPRVQYSLETASALKPFMDINGAVSEINTSEVVVIEDTTIREFVVNLGSVVSRTNVEIFFAESAQGSRELSAIIDVDPDVENTVLIEYTNRRNDFDTVFNPANKFSFRVEGCFLPQEFSFDSETESFRDQRHKSKLLSGFPVEKRTLSIGGGFGVPNWAARLINGIFCLSNVEVDGERMIRVDGGVELSMIHNDYPLYIYKIELEHTEDEEVSDILSLLRVVDSKKKVARSTGDDVRVYNAFAKDFGITDSKMIRELSTIEEIAGNFYIEIDDNVSSNTGKATLNVFQQFIFNGWIDQPVRTTDDVKFNSVTSSNGKWEISEDGIIKIIKAIVIDTIQSDNFFSGSIGSGFSIMKNDSTGKSYLEIDKIYARFKAIFQSVEIRKLLYSIGNYTYGPAGSRCTRVVETGNVYRCFFTADDGELAVENTFHVDDLVKCQEFNVKVGVHGVTKNRYYWRRCVGVGSDYIDLSKTDCDVDSDIPAAGDDMVAQGNKTDRERQSVIVISVVGEDAPSVTLYDGINDYSLDGKAKTRVGGGSVDSFFTGNFFLTNGKNVQDEIDKTNQSVDQAIQDMANTINLVKELEQNVGNLQDQIDGVIETWFYDPVPTLSNEPAVNWTTDNDKNNHLGDLYFDKDGKSYRFENRDGVYQWTVIPDTGLEEALRKAQQAQDTADGKRRIFTTQPTTESTYDVGDLWVNATAGGFTNDILRCKVAKTSGQAFSLSHWELASKYTDDTKANEAMQSAEDAQAAADAAQAAAYKAQTDATNAKNAADAAQSSANEANSLLSDIANDNKLTAQEKQQTKKEWDIIVSEKPLNDASADKFGVSKTEYTNAYNALSTYITPLLQSLTTTSDIVGSTFRSTFKNYYDARTELLNNISAKAKDLADAAQNTADVAQENADAAKKEAEKALAKAESAQSAADTAQSTADAAATAANNAQNTANTAKTTAEAANSELNKINSDGYISPSEKGALVQQQKDIQSEYADIISQANKYGVSTTNYTTAYNSANTSLTKYTATSPTHIEVGADYANIAAYYTARQTILDAISTAAKKVATDAQADADAAKEAAEQAKQDAAQAQATANDAKADAAAAKSAADAASKAVSDLEANIEGAFADGIISEAEAIAISKYTNQVNESFTSINATYTEVYGNVYLEGTAKTNLKTKYDALVTKKNALLNAISTAIADGKATQAESQAVDTAFTAYNSAVNSYQTALEQANEAIQAKIKSYADAAQKNATKALQDAAEAKAKADAAAADAKDANDRLNSWASDSVISPTEKQAIKNEQAQVRAEKNEIVADAGKYSIATTTYVNAFNAYDAVLTKYSASSPENITIGTDFNSTQTTYYAERTRILGLIADGAKKYVDDIQVGTRNLWIYKNIGSYLRGIITNKINISVNKYRVNVTGNPSDLVGCRINTSSNKIIISGKTDLSRVICYYQCYNDGGSIQSQKNTSVNATAGKFEIRLSIPDLTTYVNIGIGLYPYQSTYYLEDISVVEGDKVVGFTPSPEDVDANLEKYKTEVSSQFEKTDERISQSVTETKTYTDEAIGNIKVGSVNLISKKMMLAWNEKNPDIAVWGQDADGVYLGINQSLLYNAFRVDGVSQDIFSNKIKYKANTQYVLSVDWRLSGVQDYGGLIIYIGYTDGTSASIGLMPTQTTLRRSNITSSKDKTIQKIYCSYGRSTYRSLIYAISLIEGNQIPTEIPEAVEDIQDLQTGSTNLITDRQNIITVGSDTPDYTSYSSELNSKGEREVTVTAIKVANKRYSRYKWLQNKLSEQVYPGFYVFSFDYKTNHGDCSISFDWRNTDHSNNLIFYKALENTNGEWRRGWFICDWRTGTTQKMNLFAVNPNCSVVGNYVAYRNIKLVRGNRGWDDSVAPQDIEKDIDAAAEKAAVAQKAADAAKSSAEAANNELSKMNNDGYISPSEKSMLKQQQKDIQTEYNDIISQAGKYSIATSSYTTAYNSANSALTKYTAASPTHITVESDYANISAYYTARQTILNSISTAAKKVADDAQEAADKAQETVDNLQIGGTNIIPKASFGSSSQYATAEVQTETLFGEKVVKYTKLSTGQPPLVTSSLKLEPGQTYTASIYIKNGTANGASEYGRITFYKSSQGVSLASSRLLSPSSEWTQLSVTFTNSKNVDSCGIYAYASPAVGNETYLSCMKVEVGNRATPGYSLSQDSLATVAMEKTIAGINNEPGKVTVFATKQQYNDQQELISQLDSSITVQAGRIDSVVSDISGLNTRISQTESDIELKVDASGIISAINLSKEGVAIKGDRIEITGQTVFKDSNGNKVNIFGQGDKVLTINNGVFSVSETGLLTATNADIQGKITATSGKIGGFNIGTGAQYWLSSGGMGISGGMLIFEDSERTVMVGSGPGESTAGSPKTCWLQIGSRSAQIADADSIALFASAQGEETSFKKNYAIYTDYGDIRFGQGRLMFKPYVWGYVKNGAIPVQNKTIIYVLGNTGSDNPCYLDRNNAIEGQVVIIVNRTTNHRLNITGTLMGDHWIPDGSLGVFVYVADQQKWVPLRM